MHEGFGLGMGGFGGLFMIAFWVLVIIGIVFLIKLIMGGTKKEGNETPLDILKKRYAKGDINKEEFEEKKKHINS